MLAVMTLGYNALFCVLAVVACRSEWKILLRNGFARGGFDGLICFSQKA